MPGIRLQLIRGTDGDGAVRDLPGARFVVGRCASCAVRLRTSAASRKHAILEYGNGVWLAKDLGSRNGLFLNGHRIGEAEIRPLDSLAFGERGAVVRIVSLDPAPPMDAGGPDATRAFQSAKVLNAVPLERIAVGRPPVSPEGSRTGVGACRIRALVLALLGLAFGGLTAFWVWGTWWFPYDRVLAPIHFAEQRIHNLAPEFMLRSGLWVSRGLTALWFALLFASLARPRWWPLSLVLVAAHFLAA